MDHYLVIFAQYLASHLRSTNSLALGIELHWQMASLRPPNIGMLPPLGMEECHVLKRFCLVVFPYNLWSMLIPHLSKIYLLYSSIHCSLNQS